jgi:rRNA-processing protein FCF1
MNEAVSLILKHRRSGALLDANLLLIYAVGKYDKNFLSVCHHTKQYTADFPLIEYLIEFFSILYTTPNVLTEVSNLGGKLGPTFFVTLGAMVSVLREEYCASKDAASNAAFGKLGLTDAGIINVAAKKCLVLTADWALYQTLRSNDIDAVNINHLRQLEWLGQLQHG